MMSVVDLDGRPGDPVPFRFKARRGADRLVRAWYAMPHVLTRAM